MSEIVYNPEQFYLLFHFVIFTFFILLAEWKKDWIYCLFVIAISIEFGIVTMTNANIHVIITIVLFCIAIYFMFLSLGYMPFFKKYFDKFRESFDFGDTDKD